VIVDPELAKRKFKAEIRPLLEDGTAYRTCGIRLVRYAWPALIVALRWNDGEAILRVDATDYDTAPIDGTWIDGSGNQLLCGHKLVPAGNGFHAQGRGGAHTPGGLCFPGWRYYYELHTEHTWSALRGKPGYKPLALIQHIASLLTRGVEAA
jgi:hypothetical protein